jgi:hypothetical protein
MSFELLMRDCAANEDARQREAAALDREQALLEATAIVEAFTGNFEKLWSAVDYADHDTLLMRVLMRAHIGGDVDASSLVKKLARTYAEINAEVTE